MGVEECQEESLRSPRIIRKPLRGKDLLEGVAPLTESLDDFEKGIGGPETLGRSWDLTLALAGLLLTERRDFHDKLWVLVEKIPGNLVDTTNLFAVFLHEVDPFQASLLPWRGVPVTGPVAFKKVIQSSVLVPPILLVQPLHRRCKGSLSVDHFGDRSVFSLVVNLGVDPAGHVKVQRGENDRAESFFGNVLRLHSLVVVER